MAWAWTSTRPLTSPIAGTLAMPGTLAMLRTGGTGRLVCTASGSIRPIGRPTGPGAIASTIRTAVPMAVASTEGVTASTTTTLTTTTKTTAGCAC